MQQPKKLIKVLNISIKVSLLKQFDELITFYSVI